MAVDPASWTRMYPEFELPEDQKKAWINDRSSAIVGIDTAKKFNWKVGDRVPLISPIYRKPDGLPWDFTIAGIYDSKVKGTDKTQFFFHWQYINETFRNTPVSDQVGWYVVRVADPASADQLAKRIDTMFANSPTETKTSTEKAWISDFAGQIGDIGAIMVRIAALVMGLILFVAGNAMAQSIRERINELGVLKTLGFGDGRILALVLFESCALALIGGALGLGIAWFIIAQGDPTGGFLPAFYFPVRDLVLGVALVFGLGVATGIIPALQASRLKIVDALRRT
jgi:putative ABC transport system permease protein